MLTGFFGPQLQNADPSLWSPMIKVALSDSVDPNHQHVVASDLTALIDTGSDYCRIDEDVATRFGLQIEKYVPAFLAGEQSKNAIYHGQLVFEDATWMQVFFGSGTFRKNGLLFDLLVGMDVIRFYELTVARKSQAVSLRWVGS